MSELLTIDGHDVAKGRSAIIKLNVSQLPSGTPIDINVHVFRARKSGPVVLLLGGMHGDEINGVEIVRRALRSKRIRKIKTGTVIAIPVLNVFGFNLFSRAVPDGKDVNRSFPGTASGSLASRVAHTLSKKVLPLVDFVMDFHTGGSTIYNYPQIRTTVGDARGMELAKAFSAPMILQNKTITKSLRSHAAKMGRPVIIFEGGESLRLDEFSISVGLEGIENVLTAEGMLEAEDNGPSHGGSSMIFSNSKWVRAPRAGIFTLAAKAGDQVTKGDLLGQINRLEGRKPVSVLAPYDCYLFSHVNNPVVSRGDALFHLVF